MTERQWERSREEDRERIDENENRKKKDRAGWIQQR